MIATWMLFSLFTVSLPADLLLLTTPPVWGCAPQVHEGAFPIILSENELHELKVLESPRKKEAQPWHFRLLGGL